MRPRASNVGFLTFTMVPFLPRCLLEDDISALTLERTCCGGENSLLLLASFILLNGNPGINAFPSLVLLSRVLPLVEGLILALESLWYMLLVLCLL